MNNTPGYIKYNILPDQYYMPPGGKEPPVKVLDVESSKNDDKIIVHDPLIDRFKVVDAFLLAHSHTLVSQCTVWKRKQSDGSYTHNHYELGHVDGDKPKSKDKQQEKQWAGGAWVKEYSFITTNAVIPKIYSLPYVEPVDKKDER